MVTLRALSLHLYPFILSQSSNETWEEKNIHVEQVIVFAHQKLIFPQSLLLSNVSKHLLESLVTFCLPGSSGTTAVLTPCLEGQKVIHIFSQLPYNTEGVGQIFLRPSERGHINFWPSSQIGTFSFFLVGSM